VKKIKVIRLSPKGNSKSNIYVDGQQVKQRESVQIFR